MKTKKNIFEKITRGVELYTESLPKQPLLEIIGTSRVIIENHFGISLYSRDLIHVKVSYGEVFVSGICLEVIQMTKFRLVIGGIIHRIELREKELC